MAQKGFYYDMTKCVGCKVCQIACKDKNNKPLGVNFRKVITTEGGKYPRPWVYFLSLSCNHCKDPRCVKNCPTGAMHKRTEDGLVVVNKDRCIGCRNCAWACPYEAPQFLETEGRTVKCDGCVDLISEGKNPTCVDACMMRCLQFGDLDKLKNTYTDVSEAANMPASSLTNPSVIIKTKAEARR